MAAICFWDIFQLIVAWEEKVQHKLLLFGSLWSISGKNQTPPGRNVSWKYLDMFVSFGSEGPQRYCCFLTV